MVAWWSPGGRLVVAWWSPGCRLVVAWWLRASCAPGLFRILAFWYCLICDLQPLACDDRFSFSQTLPLALCSFGRPWGNLWPGSGVLIVDCGVPRHLAHRVDASISFLCSAVLCFYVSVMALLLFTAHALHDPVSCGVRLGWSTHGRLGATAVRCLVFCPDHVCGPSVVLCTHL